MNNSMVKQKLLLVVKEHAHKIVDYIEKSDEINVIDIEVLLIDAIEEYLRILTDSMKLER